ncbi:MAG: tetratricopeptide repeat protein [Deltaproteobacteria bacterium]|nr:tetratricopeptide repeat protein [Deltaproteobacteria bacterium]
MELLTTFGRAQPFAASARLRGRVLSAWAVVALAGVVATPVLGQQKVEVEVETVKPRPAGPEAGTATVEVAPAGPSVRELVRAGRIDDALRLVDQQLALHPGDDELRVQRARLLYWKGQWATALQEAETVLQRHPADIEVLELVAQVRLALGDVAKALECYMGMQAVGDNRPEIHQRVLDLLLVLKDLPGLEAALLRGGRLTDEQELARARIAHPWSVDGGLGATLYNGNVWPRLDLGVGRRVHKQATLVGGVQVEQRTQGAYARVAWAPRAELYASAGRFSAMVHASGSPSRAFLPLVDARADVAVAINDSVGLGLWVRYAVYAPLDATPVSSLTLGPNLPIHIGRLTLTPGYVAVLLWPGAVAQSAMIKLRFEATARTAWFTWFYAGDDPNFIDRQSARPARGLTALVGVEHWFSGRVGMRLSATRIQPFGNFNPFTEVSLGVRGRL